MTFLLFLYLSWVDSQKFHGICRNLRLHLVWKRISNFCFLLLKICEKQKLFFKKKKIIKLLSLIRLASLIPPSSSDDHQASTAIVSTWRWPHATVDLDRHAQPTLRATHHRSCQSTIPMRYRKRLVRRSSLAAWNGGK